MAGWVAPTMGKRSLKTINSVIKEGQDAGWSDTYLARQLALIVPLDERSRRSLTNYRRGLKSKNTPPGKMARLVSRYSKKLTMNRAMTIARTERAKLQTQQRQLDFSKQHEKRRWVTRPGGCPFCQAMHGMERDPDAPYGDIPGPPAHPNCRCREEVVNP